MIDLSMKLSKNFTLKELVYSGTAVSLKIDNTPTPEIVERLRVLCQNVLQPVRDHFGKPVLINSGYRCPKLNTAIKGAKTSQHVLGYAADFEIMGLSNWDLAVWIRNNLKYDQLILEYATNLSQNPNNGWVHCSFVDNKINRNQPLTINNKGTFYGLRLM